MRGSIKRTKAGTWRVVVDAGTDTMTGKRRQVVKTVRGTKKQAEVELNRILVAQGRGAAVPSGLTLEVLVEQWFAITEANLSPKTMEDRRRTWRMHIAPGLAKRKLSDLGAADLDALYSRMTMAGYKPASIRKVHAFLSGALGQAVKYDYLAVNPASRATPPKVPPTNAVVPDVGDVSRVLRFTDERWPEFAVLVRLGAMTGLRRGELCALRWADIDLEAGVLSVNRAVVAVSGRLVLKETKTSRPRRLALGPATVALLKAHRTATGERLLSLGVPLEPTSFLFPADIAATEPTHPSTVSHRWLQACRAVGVAGIRLHDLRHHSASQLVAAGTDLRTVLERHGWTGLATAQRYIHAVDAQDREAAEVLERALGH